VISFALVLCFISFKTLAWDQAEIDAGIKAHKMALSADGRYVLVADHTPHSLLILDAATLQPIKSIEVQNSDGISSRVNAVYTAPPHDSFIATLRDIPEIWQISYADDPPTGFDGWVHDYRVDSGENSEPEPFPVRRIKLDAPLDKLSFDQEYVLLTGMTVTGEQRVVDLDLGRAVDADRIVHPGEPPVMQAFELQTAPVIDGVVLGDPAWQGLIPATGFWQVQPDEGTPATQRTEVFIGFLDDALYIGLVAYDDNPDGIIVTDSRRDSELDETDSFRVIIDGLLDKQNGYIFGTNPAGLEYDAQIVKEGVNGGFNLNWDASWSVQARISEIGWSAEMLIPFKSLRYGKGDKQVWGVNFQRNIRRNNEVTYWAPLTRQRNLNRVSEAGTVEGVMPPAQRNLKITPYLLAKGRRGGELDGTESDQEFGFDIKYSLTPSLTLDATYNTDFAQVEADEQQVNLDRFNLFFPEKRPFFLENAGQFKVGNNQEAELFFSRRIGIGGEGELIPIDGGVRVSGKLGNRTNVGFLYMSAEDVENIAPGNQFTVARVNQENGDGSYLVAESDDKNRTYGIDGKLGIGENTIIQAWAALTDTPGLEGDDHAYSVKANYDAVKWSHSLEYTEIGENFNPEVGFLSRREYRKFSAFSMRRIRPDDLWGLLEVRPHASYRGYWDFDGFQETGFLHTDIHWEWKNGYEFHTGFNVTRDGIKEPFDIVDGVTVAPGTYDDTEVAFFFTTNRSAPLSFSFSTTIGGRFGGDRFSISPSVNYRIGEKFTSSLSVNYNDFDLPDGQFEVMLSRLRLSYSFTPKILLQALVQYNDDSEVFGTNLRFSWLRTANTGFYLVYNEIDERIDGSPPTGRELIIKYSYMFDVFK